jgi:hypothetical protein
MRKLTQLVVALQIWKDRKGQDAIMPGVASSINIVFSKVNSIMIKAAAS